MKISRRNLLARSAAGALVASGGIASGSESSGASSGPAPERPDADAVANPIPRENARPGTTDWQLTYVRAANDCRSPWIEGYASRASVAAGESIDLMISADPPGPVRVEVYRMGWYGGAGGRLVATLGPLDAPKQPDPPVGEQRLHECRWAPVATLPIPRDWLSGVYLAKLSRLDDRWQSYAIFLVREAADSPRRPDFLFQCSDNTWQAYNRWPSRFSLYDAADAEWALRAGIRVSYDRPYGKYRQILDAPLSQGSGEFLLWEFPLAFWMEREGFDVAYCSNTDVHASADLLLRSRAFLSVGHDEYWSLEQFRHVMQARDAGVNLAFFSGNTCCFVAPLEPSSDGRPARVFSRAGRYGGLSEAEKKNMGPFPLEGPNEATLIGARTTNPYNGSGDWIVTDPDCWIFEGTGMRAGDRIPGLVGWEFHGEPAAIEGLRIVAEGEAINAGGEKAHWTATLYPGPKGNHVFNASTIWWAQGLSAPPGFIPPHSHFGRPHGPDARVERITRNVLERFRAR